MLDILSNRRFAHLFGAQIVALIGTGLATVALGLLAYDLSGADAGLVLGGVFAIKMVAYVGIAPVAGAFANFVPRRKMLVALDLVRGGVAICLPFVTEVWQIFALIFLLQAASAAFTPTFQATLPDILPAEKDYTKALSLSRLAYDLESLITPSLAAALLLVTSYHTLFFGTALGFVASALLILSVVLPMPLTDGKRRSIYERTTLGIRIYLKTPRLRGLLALCMIVAAAGAMVLVNSIVLIRSVLGLDEVHVAYGLAAFGAGSMVVALVLPRLLDRLADRSVMMAGSWAMIGALGVLAGLYAAQLFTWESLLLAWFVIGAGYSAVLTPSGRLLQRSSHEEDRPAVYAAQFALSHACWLLCYPLSGILQNQFDTQTALVSLMGLSLLSLFVAIKLWPKDAQRSFTHSHPDLPADHPHLTAHHGEGGHSHVYIIDDYHPHWPKGA